MEMNALPLMMAGLLDPLYVAFGWIMRMLYFVFDNYGVMIIVFTIFIRSIMIPLYTKQQKTTLKQGQLSDEIADLKRSYGSDSQGFAVAQQELLKNHKISMFSGCLPQIVALFMIWPIWRIISSPLRYIMGVSAENIQIMADRLNEMGKLTQAEFTGIANRDIPLISALTNNGDALSEFVGDGLIRADQLINLDFLGLNLGVQPTWQPAQLFGDQMSTYLPLLLIPILAVITTILVSKISENTNPSIAQNKKQAELAKKNPARDNAQPDQAAGMMKSMKFMMPVMTLMTVFFAPAAMGMYWIVGNLMAIVQSLLLYNLYTKPVFEKVAEQEKQADMVLNSRKETDKNA